MTLLTVHDRYSEQEIGDHYATGIWRTEHVFGLVEKYAVERGEGLFGTDSTSSHTYGELGGAAVRLATGLVRCGVGPQDRVVVQLPNWAEFFVMPRRSRGSGQSWCR